MSVAAKWLQTARISWTNQLAYPLNLVLLVIGPMLVFFFVRFNLWEAIFSLEGVTTIQGYDKAGMLQYQAWVLIVSLVAQGYTNMEIAHDIRMGRISVFMIYPFDFWQFHAAGFLAFQTVQTVIALVTAAALYAAGIVPSLTPATFLPGLAFCWAVGTLWFVLQFIIGSISFWLEETWMLRVMLGLIASFLSGAMVPLEIFPDWLRTSLDYSPFPYMTWVPTRMFMGVYDGNVPAAFALLGVWIVVCIGIATVVWRRGVRLYTAAGM